MTDYRRAVTRLEELTPNVRAHYYKMVDSDANLCFPDAYQLVRVVGQRPS